MKVILKQDVKGFGKKGDVKDVSQGYFLNFLLPLGKAIFATESDFRALERKKSSEKVSIERTQAEGSALAEKLKKTPLVLKAKANAKSGKLFGALTEKDIVHALNETLEVNLEPSQVLLTEHIKSVGPHTALIKIASHTQVTIHLQVEAV